MKNKAIIWIILLAAVVGIAVVVADLMSQKRGRLPGNAFAYPDDVSAGVEESEIGYIETRRMVIKQGKPKAFAYADGKIYLLVDSQLQVLTPQGERLSAIGFGKRPYCVAISESDVLVGFERRVESYDFSRVVSGTASGGTLNPVSGSAPGRLKYRSAELPEGSYISALAVWNDRVYVADAGSKHVRILNPLLQEVGVFRGESGVSDQHGFIIPSLHFTLAVNADGELWVVNPGLHAIQQYSLDGVFKGQWGQTSFETVGFSGCCNPCEIAFLPDGSFVTTEKGLVRVKVYKPSGELLTVVASPDAFPDTYKAPDVAVDENGTILVLDVEQGMLRFFSPKPEQLNE